MMIKCVLFLVTILTAIDRSASRTDCAMRYFDGSETKSGLVYCGTGYRQCEHRSEGCCSTVYATPVQLTLVVLGPVTLLFSFLLVALVIKTVVGVVLDDLENGQTAIAVSVVQ